MPTLISRKKKFIYLHNPKVAGVSISNILTGENILKRNIFEKLLSRIFNLSIFNSRLNDKQLDIIPKLDYLFNGHLDMQTLSKCIEKSVLDEYFVFAFVREPLSRSYSEYRFIKRQKYHWLHNRIVNISFEEYLNILKEVGFQTQYSFLGGKTLISKINFIGYFENLENDWRNISEIIKIKQLSLPKNNVSPSQRRKYKFTKKEKSLVYELYEEDFKHFYPAK